MALLRKGYFGFRIRNDGDPAIVHVARSRMTLCELSLRGRFTLVPDSEPVTCKACLRTLRGS